MKDKKLRKTVNKIREGLCRLDRLLELDKDKGGDGMWVKGSLDRIDNIEQSINLILKHLKVDIKEKGREIVKKKPE